MKKLYDADRRKRKKTVNASHDFVAVRPATRRAWDALLDEGEVPSVRKLYQRIGGKYPRLVAECRVLRAEGNTTGEAEGNGPKPAGAQQPTRKTYACHRWPFLHLGGIKFRDGVYMTDDEDVQAMIENSDSYGVHIHEAQGNTWH
jgi:hypothetical protein